MKTIITTCLVCFSIVQNVSAQNGNFINPPMEIIYKAVEQINKEELRKNKNLPLRQRMMKMTTCIVRNSKDGLVFVQFKPGENIFTALPLSKEYILKSKADHMNIVNKYKLKKIGVCAIKIGSYQNGDGPYNQGPVYIVNLTTGEEFFDETCLIH
jgi:hypothetical protein